MGGGGVSNPIPVTEIDGRNKQLRDGFRTDEEAKRQPHSKATPPDPKAKSKAKKNPGRREKAGAEEISDAGAAGRTPEAPNVNTEEKPKDAKKYEAKLERFLQLHDQRTGGLPGLCPLYMDLFFSNHGEYRSLQGDHHPEAYAV